MQAWRVISLGLLPYVTETLITLITLITRQLRPAPSRGSAGLAGVSTRPAGLSHPWGTTSCREAAALTYLQAAARAEETHTCRVQPRRLLRLLHQSRRLQLRLHRLSIGRLRRLRLHCRRRSLSRLLVILRRAATNAHSEAARYMSTRTTLLFTLHGELNSRMCPLRQ